MGWHVIEKTSNVSVVVPVRAGSTRVKEKNLREFYRREDGTVDSLLSWKLRQLTQVFKPQNIILSTDWENAIQVGKDFGIKVHRRDERLCTSDAPFDEVILDAAKMVKTDHMAWAPVTSPFFGSDQIKKFIDTYLLDLSSCQDNGLIAGEHLKGYFFIGGSPINFPLGKGHVQTQGLAPVFEWEWAFSARRTHNVLKDSYMFSNAVSFFGANKLANFDINDPLDFEIAKKLTGLYLELTEE